MDASGWDERYRSADLVWGAEPNRFVREHCAQLPPGEVVDLACGEGRNALWLASIGWRVTGIDYSPVAIARAEDLSADQPAAVRARLTWRVADVTQLPLEPASLDLALLSYLHLPPDQLAAVVTSAARALRPAGHLVIVGHDVRNLTEGVSGPQDRNLLYEPAALRRLLTRQRGISVENALTATRPTDAGDALDTVVVARRR